MHPTKLQGIIPPMITPLKGDDELDREGTVRLTEHLVAGGVHAIFLLGTTGEAQSLTYRLRYEFVELVCRQVAGRIPVLVGVTDTAFIESVRLAEHAAKCGAVGVVAAPPYYFAPSQQELIEYYTALADALPLPLYLYNLSLIHILSPLEEATLLRSLPESVPSASAGLYRILGAVCARSFGKVRQRCGGQYLRHFFRHDRFDAGAD